MNKIFLTGRLTRDVEIRTAQQDTRVAQFSIAVDRPKNKNGEAITDFFNVVAWGKAEELCEKYARKGMKLLVEGRLQTRNYDDKDGKKVYVTEVIAERIEFLEKLEKKEEPTTTNSDFTPVDDSDLPF